MCVLPTEYLANNPDVAAAYDVRNADIQNLTPEQFAQRHYDEAGKDEGRVPAGGYSKYGDDAQMVVNRGGPNPGDDGLDDPNAGTTDQLNNLITGLLGQIDGQAEKFASSQKELLASMGKAGEAQSAAMRKAVDDLLSAQNARGQGAKRPNYAAALRRNKDLNGSGLSSTMLTGAGGTAPGALSLGQTSLLGA